MFKNFKNIDKVVYGRGAFSLIGEILASKRNSNDQFFVFIVDEYFKNKALISRIPLTEKDVLLFENVDRHEPTTEQIDF